MNEDNPWRAQMMKRSNKPPDGSKSTPRNGDALIPNKTSTPPWLNKNQNNTTTPPNNTSSPTAVNPPKEPNAPSWKAGNSGASQPPWANKNSGSTTGPSTANQQPPANTNAGVRSSVTPGTGGGSNPSWVKPGGQQPTQPSSASDKQPPWVVNQAKKAASEVQENPPSQSNQPGWVKSSPNSSMNQGSAPPWARKDNPSPNSSLNASGIKSNVGSQPPWAQKNDGNSQAAGQAAWKMKQAADIEKQKKDLEAQMRKEEEQQKERKRIEKQRRQKQQEAINIKRELIEMAREDELSRLREQEDKQRKQDEARREKEQQQQRQKEQKQREQQQSRERQEQERKQKEEEELKLKLQASKQSGRSRQRKSRKLRISNFQSSKISHISSIKGVQNIESSLQKQAYLTDNLFRRYIRLLAEECAETDYRHKIMLQKSILQVQMEFSKECETELSQLLSSHKITNRKRKVVFSNNKQVSYGLCEGKRIAGGIQFQCEEADELRKKFVQYEMLSKCINTLLKKKKSLHLRAPMYCLAQLKGITFLVEHVCDELTDIIETDIGMFQEISSEVLMLERQLQNQHDQKHGKLLTRDKLMVKKIALSGQDYYVVYTKDEPKTKNTEGQSPGAEGASQLSDMRLLEEIATPSSLLPYYNPTSTVSPQVIEFLSKMGNAAQKSTLRNLTLAQAIYMVYSSCQGEVNQESFFRLLLENNEQLWNMVRQAGCHQSRVTPLSLVFLRLHSYITFSHPAKQRPAVETVKPRIYIQRHDFQLLDFIKNLDKYIEEDKQELVQEAIHLNRMLWDEILRLPAEAFHFQRVKSQVGYLLYQRKETQALEYLQHSKELLSYRAVERIPLSLLFIKIYIVRDMEVELLKELGELLELLEFYFREETTIHAHIYAIMGSYYSRKEVTQQRKVMTFYEHALEIGLRLHGEKAIEVAEIYLSRANACANMKIFSLFHKDLPLALKIYKSHSKSGTRIAQCHYLQGKVACLEGKLHQGVQNMQNSAELLLKMENHVQALCICFELLSFLAGDEVKYQAILEQIVEICFNYKSLWAFRQVCTLILDRELHCYTALTVPQLQQLLTDEHSLTCEEMMIDLQEEIKGFTSFVEIVRWALSIVAARMGSRRQNSSEYEKACAIMQGVVHFYTRQQAEVSFDVRDSQILG